MMKKINIVKYLLLGSLLCASQSSFAVMIGFEPNYQLVNLGDQATVDIVVSDLGGAEIGGFDFSTAWDDSILALSDVSFGSALGDTDPFSLETMIDSIAGIGNVELSGLSLLFDLTGLQNGVDDVVLATLTFDTLSTGISGLDLIGSILPRGGFLSDSAGMLLATTANSGEIEVVASVPVPAPTSILLFGIGFLAMRLRRVAGNGR